MGILIAVDGVDSSGKQTQTELLRKRLKSDGVNIRAVSFPVYDSPSSSLIKMYLDGEFGTNPDDVNAYTASAFFALDRFASYKTDWGADYNGGAVILADRYTTSNMIHQAGKIDDLSEKKKFIDWVYDFEYNICGLPKPDITIFLDMPPEYGIRLMENRANKIDGTDVKDIHERNREYLQKSYDNAVFVAESYGWKRIVCAENGAVRSIEDINDEVYSAVKAVLTDI
ncbi:MAG: thymidylate kinase [Firmicutes bacterium]|nr:thymidylate kinase [Bacillota bacterium]